MNSMPWERWEFNKEFFESLSRYRKNHPETTFSILDNICYTVENGKDLFEAIPDALVPFRGFVKALACLLKLGIVSQIGHGMATKVTDHITISLDGQKGKRVCLRVCQTSCLLGGEHHVRVRFRRQLLLYLGDLAQFEGDAVRGYLSLILPRSHNATVDRDLVDEICAWANSRLVCHVLRFPRLHANEPNNNLDR